MSSKTIYIVRHGETEYNRKGIVQGSQVDAPLNDKGKVQAQKFYEFYKDYNPDAIFVSTLQRTKESVQKFIDKFPAFEQDSALNEISWGTADGKIPNDDPMYLEVVKKWSEGEVTLNAGNGESPQDVYERQVPFVKEKIINSKNEKILICMHGRAMRILFCLLLGKPLLEMDSFSHTNLCLYEFIYDNNQFKLIRANNVEHLK